MDFLDISSLGVAYRYASKSSRNSSNRVSEILGLKIFHNRGIKKETLTHRIKYISARKAHLNRSIPRHKKEG
jgi:hypothetical protein